MTTTYCYSITDDCINHNSYGAICVWCNCCGRVDKKTMKEAQLEYYKECLEEQYNFDGLDSVDGIGRNSKEKNVKENIEYFKKKIAEVEEMK